MTEVFGQSYAAAYDLLYADKDYDAECDILEQVFRRSGQPIRTVLDLGCGTGAHAIRLAQRGYEVTGVDISESMLRGARERASATGTDHVEFIQGDIRTLQLEETFDAAICMFAVLGYQTSRADVAAALTTVRNHLRPGGWFVFDIWYGPAVEATGPTTRVKLVPAGEGEIERHATAVLEPDRQLCTVSYRLIRRAPGVPDAEVEETHRMRYFFPDELATSLAGAGLQLESLATFPDASTPVSADSWNVIATATG